MHPARARDAATERGERDNIVVARVEELIYHGDHTRARLRVPGSSDFLIRVPNTRSELNIVPGLTIEIGWWSGDCRALDAPPK